jgi:two-component system, OmpR family, phosphate regulon sensor histidine kinase PhoR
VKKPGTLKKTSLVLLLVVLLPALFYSGYELSSLSTTEDLMASIYNQQLDVILFSFNEYAWDVANNWASRFDLLLKNNGSGQPDRLAATINSSLENNSAVLAITLSDSGTYNVRFYPNQQWASRTTINKAIITTSLKHNNDRIERLLRYHRSNYRKIEPIQFSDEQSNRYLALTFVSDLSDANPTIVTLVLNEDIFIRDYLSNKLRETAGEQFVLAVFRKGTDRPLFATSPITKEQIKQTKDLWLFPNSVLGIRPQGTTIDELVRSRFARNLTIIIIMDIMLAAGAWIVYRNMKKEMELVRLKSDFVSNVSHELRTPLSLIRMFAETLDMGRLTSEEKKREYYATILQETERLTRLVNNILNFSRMDAGKKEYHFEQTNINETVSAVIATYQLRLQTEGFIPIVELDNNIQPLRADKEAVSEAIINIIDNAIKYSDKDKFLRIGTGRSEHGTFIEIEDHGIGISPSQHEKIFETFYRVSSGLVHNTKGSGLGLALVKHIMDAHGGKTTVKSYPGEGTVFRLEFPLDRK